MGLPLTLAALLPGAETAPATSGVVAGAEKTTIEVKAAATGTSTTSAPSSEPSSAPARAAQDSGGFGNMMMPILLLVVVVMYFFMLRGPRKEEKNRKAALAAMKKGDEVLLISGKFGTVVDIRDDRVVVKVDETNNVKETYLKNAIQKVIVADDTTKK